MWKKNYMDKINLQPNALLLHLRGVLYEHHKKLSNWDNQIFVSMHANRDGLKIIKNTNRWRVPYQNSCPTTIWRRSLGWESKLGLPPWVSIINRSIVRFCGCYDTLATPYTFSFSLFSFSLFLCASATPITTTLFQMKSPETVKKKKKGWLF
jgi:hypothetical protein